MPLLEPIIFWHGQDQLIIILFRYRAEKNDVHCNWKIINTKFLLHKRISIKSFVTIKIKLKNFILFYFVTNCSILGNEAEWLHHDKMNN